MGGENQFIGLGSFNEALQPARHRLLRADERTGKRAARGRFFQRRYRPALLGQAEISDPQRPLYQTADGPDDGYSGSRQKGR